MCIYLCNTLSEHLCRYSSLSLSLSLSLYIYIYMYIYIYIYYTLSEHLCIHRYSRLSLSLSLYIYIHTHTPTYVILWVNTCAYTAAERAGRSDGAAQHHHHWGPPGRASPPPPCQQPRVRACRARQDSRRVASAGAPVFVALCASVRGSFCFWERALDSRRVASAGVRGSLLWDETQASFAMWTGLFCHTQLETTEERLHAKSIEFCSKKTRIL